MDSTSWANGAPSIVSIPMTYTSHCGFLEQQRELDQFDWATNSARTAARTPTEFVRVYHHASGDACYLSGLR
jgi:hypothetical protein